MRHTFLFLVVVYYFLFGHVYMAVEELYTRIEACWRVLLGTTVWGAGTKKQWPVEAGRWNRQFCLAFLIRYCINVLEYGVKS